MKLEDLYKDVEEFNNKVIGLSAPDKPMLLDADRHEFARKALLEEVDEFTASFVGTVCLEEAGDALIDLIYFALGRLMEMGLPVQNMWDEVHAKNMLKVKGEKDRGTDIDAIKPEGWSPPDHSWVTQIPEPFIQAIRLRIKKGDDYRSGSIKMKDYFPYGLQSYSTMIHTKSLRLVSLLQSNNKPKHESIRDSLVDLLNYTCFAIEAIDKGEV